jgi:hypothetical protein
MATANKPRPLLDLGQAAEAVAAAAVSVANAATKYLDTRRAWHDAREQLDIAWRDYMESRERSEA